MHMLACPAAYNARKLDSHVVRWNVEQLVDA